MDFDLTDEQQATIDAASKLLADKATPETLRAVEAADDLRFDRALWSAMADAGLLGIGVPEAHGGAGLGIFEVCLVLEEVGRRTALVPALPALVAGDLLALLGSDEQQAAWLPGLAAGTAVPALALTEDVGDPRRPTTVASPASGGGWLLDGTKTNVAAGLVADVLVVSATTPDGAGLFLVDPRGQGATLTRQDTTTGVPEAAVQLDGAPATALGPVDGTTVDVALERSLVGACAVLAGVTAEAVRITGEYTASREQFGRPIATFQAVGQRAADAYVDAHAVRLTMLQAAWRIAHGKPAAREVAVAKYWASAGGQRVVHAAQHLHGGVGVDRDYPLHRYFLLAKQLELHLGGASRQLARLGALLAD